jgi:dolichol-phosphate mannosyltransferase
MIDGLRVAVVVPSYRVAREVPDVVRAMPAGIDRIIVVDDASPDDICAALASISDARLRLLRHETNQGVGGATVTGMLAALEEGVDVVVKCDGDGQMDPRDIPALLQPIVSGSAEHVKGSRYHHARQLASMPRGRLIGNIGLTFLTKLCSGYWNVLDPVNGFFATRTDTLSRLPLDKLSRRYFFETDLLIRLNILEARVADMPQPARYGGETSSLSLRHALWEFPWQLLRGLGRRIFWRYLFYDVSPVAVFGIGGALLTMFGVSFGAWQWISHAVQGIPTPLGTIMLAVLPLVLGFQLLLQSVILDIENTPRASVRTSALVPRLRSATGSTTPAADSSASGPRPAAQTTERDPCTPAISTRPGASSSEP